jgi:hypothetical protein
LVPVIRFSWLAEKGWPDKAIKTGSW